MLIVLCILGVSCTGPNDYYIDSENLVLTSKSNKKISNLFIDCDSAVSSFEIIPKRYSTEIELMRIDTSKYEIIQTGVGQISEFKFIPNVMYNFEALPAGDRANNTIQLKLDSLGNIIFLSNGFVEE